MPDLYDSSVLLHRAVCTLPFLPQTHLNALEAYVRALSPTTANPYLTFHSSLLALQSTIDATLTALTRPPRLINQINASKRTVERNYSSLSRSTRWPLGLLDDTRQRLNEEREERMRAGQEEVNNLSRELRYTQQTVAMELAGWQDMHERMGRRAIRELARGMVVVEKMRLEGMKRALRKLKEASAETANSVREGDASEGGEQATGLSTLGPPIALAGLEMAASREADRDADLPVSTDSVKAPPPPKKIIGDTPAAGTSAPTANGILPSELAGLPPAERENLFGKDEGGSASGQVT